jgi:hypothetical protein
VATQVERALKKALAGKLAKTPPPPKGLTQRGPAVLAIGSPELVGDTPENLPDELFVTGTTSLTEKMVYFGILKEYGPPEQGGVIRWDFQKSLLGGRHLSGGLVADFIIDPYGLERPTPLLLRVQSFEFHMAKGELINAYDFEQIDTLFDFGYDVIDLFDVYFIFDETGQAARENVRDALNGIQRPNPSATGLVFDPY